PCSSADPRPPHSFPTRRSSDLGHRLWAAQASRGGQGPIARVRVLARPRHGSDDPVDIHLPHAIVAVVGDEEDDNGIITTVAGTGDRKSTRLNSSHCQMSYAVFC